MKKGIWQILVWRHRINISHIWIILGLSMISRKSSVVAKIQQSKIISWVGRLEKWQRRIEKLKDNNLNYKIWREEVDQIMKTGTPEQVERDQNWLAGIGLQWVDNLRVSNYLLELSLQNIKDEIDFDELERKLEEYHRRTEHGK